MYDSAGSDRGRRVSAVVARNRRQCGRSRPRSRFAAPRGRRLRRGRARLRALRPRAGAGPAEHVDDVVKHVGPRLPRRAPRVELPPQSRSAISVGWSPSATSKAIGERVGGVRSRARVRKPAAAVEKPPERLVGHSSFAEGSATERADRVKRRRRTQRPPSRVTVTSYATPVDLRLNSFSAPPMMRWRRSA